VAGTNHKGDSRGPKIPDVMDEGAGMVGT